MCRMINYGYLLNQKKIFRPIQNPSFCPGKKIYWDVIMENKKQNQNKKKKRNKTIIKAGKTNLQN